MGSGGIVPFLRPEQDEKRLGRVLHCTASEQKADEQDDLRRLEVEKQVLRGENRSGCRCRRFQSSRLSPLSRDLLCQGRCWMRGEHR